MAAAVAAMTRWFDDPAAALPAVIEIEVARHRGAAIAGIKRRVLVRRIRLAAD